MYKKKSNHLDSNSADYIGIEAMPLKPFRYVSNINGMNLILPKKCVNDDVKNDVTMMDGNVQLDSLNIDNEEAESGDKESNNNVNDDILKISVTEDENVSLKVANEDYLDGIGKS